MRVAFFTDTYYPQVNGVTRTLEQLLAFLKEQGGEVLVFGPADPRTRPAGRACLFKGLPVPFYTEMRLGLPFSLGLRRTILDFRPEIIHLVNEYSMGLAGLHWAKRLGVPAVACFHTDVPRYLGHYGFPFLSGVAWRYLAWFHRQCVVNFYPSRHVKEALAARGVGGLVYLERGVDTGLFSPDQYDPALRRRLGDGPLLLYVGRLAPEKGLDVAFQALELVRRQYPAAKLLLAGDGPLGPTIRRRPPAGVLPLGQLEGEDLARLYASCDLFAFPSTSETYGIVVLEAMASGLPVVAPLCGGVVENLRPGVNGLDFAPGVPEAMARAIAGLLADEPLRRQLSIQARRHAEERSWTRTLTPVIEVYRELLAGRSAPRGLVS
jgi:glycosyltransferase involved in cell wall biosynthesis